MGLWNNLHQVEILENQFKVQYSQRHTMINHCDRRITHLGDLNTSFVLLNIFSKFLLHLECYLLSPNRHIKISKQIKQTKRYISITKKSDTSITVIYHAMSLTVLYLGSKKTPKDLHRIAKICPSHRYMRNENLSFNNNYIMQEL